jgi:hypothetical protein
MRRHDLACLAAFPDRLTQVRDVTGSARVIRDDDNVSVRGAVSIARRMSRVGIVDPSVQALAAHDTDLDFDYVEPATCLGA